MGLQEAILQLSSPDECDRIYAAEDLGLAGEREGIDPLIQRVVEEPSRAVREAIFAALARIPDDAIIHRAAQLLSSDDSDIRNLALELLQSRGSAAVPELRRLLAAEDCDLRKFALDVLSRIETPASEELLAIALGDRDLNVVITALENVRHGHCPALRQRVLQHALTGEHPMVVLAAMEALGRIGDTACYRHIRQRFPSLASTPSLYLRPVLALLGAHGKDGDRLELWNFLTTCEPGLRGAVLDALRNLLDRNAADIPDLWWQGLMARLPETTADAERYQILVLLGYFGHCPPVFEMLIAYLESSAKVDRLGAIESLSRKRREDAGSAMGRRLHSEPDPEVRQALEDALRVSGQ